MISDERLQEMREANASFVSEVELAEMARELLAIRKAHEGWKLVPVEPTDEMITASLVCGCLNAKGSYAAMISAAPEPG